MAAGKSFAISFAINAMMGGSFGTAMSQASYRLVHCGAVWNAQWGPSDDLKGMMWQYTSNEYIPNGGRNGYFDANIIYE